MHFCKYQSKSSNYCQNKMRTTLLRQNKKVIVQIRWVIFNSVCLIDLIQEINFKIRLNINATQDNLWVYTTVEEKCYDRSFTKDKQH